MDCSSTIRYSGFRGSCVCRARGIGRHGGEDPGARHRRHANARGARRYCDVADRRRERRPVHPRCAAPRDPSPSYAETFYPKWHFGWSELKSVRVGDWKYIDAPKPELFDLRADAVEKRNAIDARGALANGLSTELNRSAVGIRGRCLGRSANTGCRNAGAAAQPRLRRHCRANTGCSRGRSERHAAQGPDGQDRHQPGGRHSPEMRPTWPSPS